MIVGRWGGLAPLDKLGVSLAEVLRVKPNP